MIFKKIHQAIHGSSWSIPISLFLILGALVACNLIATKSSVARTVQSTYELGPVLDDLAFQSGGVTLVGRLMLPAGRGPFPAIIWVHGSGRSLRTELDPLLNGLVRAGFAVFSYDKRGVGDSGGKYSEVMPIQGNMILGQLAEDAAAAADFIATREEIDSTHVGFFGGSMAGWIVPQAALLSEHISFIALISGPTVSVGIEYFYSALSTDEEGSLTDEEITEHSNRLSELTADGYDPHGYNPREAIVALDVPGLWIFGARDASMPVRESTLILEEIKGEYRKDITIFIYPNANHHLVDADTGFQEPFIAEVLIPWLFEVKR